MFESSAVRWRQRPIVNGGQPVIVFVAFYGHRRRLKAKKYRGRECEIGLLNQSASARVTNVRLSDPIRFPSSKGNSSEREGQSQESTSRSRRSWCVWCSSVSEFGCYYTNYNRLLLEGHNGEIASLIQEPISLIIYWLKSVIIQWKYKMYQKHTRGYLMDKFFDKNLFILFDNCLFNSFNWLNRFIR